MAQDEKESIVDITTNQPDTNTDVGKVASKRRKIKCRLFFIILMMQLLLIIVTVISLSLNYKDRDEYGKMIAPIDIFAVGILIATNGIGFLAYVSSSVNLMVSYVVFNLIHMIIISLGIYFVDEKTHVQMISFLLSISNAMVASCLII